MRVLGVGRETAGFQSQRLIQKFDMKLRALAGDPLMTGCYFLAAYFCPRSQKTFSPSKTFLALVLS